MTSMNYSKMPSIKKVLIVAAVASLLWACTKTVDSASTVECSGPEKSFTTDVKPIMDVTCSFDSDCHGSGSTSGPGSLLNYSQISGARVSIRSAVLSGIMPKGGSLTASQKNAIICWIDNGAANN
jgi:hypothetical protein